jgi:preprotein translocase subunit SecE
MGRIQKKKSENQKSKLKTKKNDDFSSNSDGANGKADVQKNDVAKRPAAHMKTNAPKKSSAPKEPGFYEKSQTFLREVKAELKKVVWPTKNQTMASTIVVIVLVIIVSSFLGLFDLGLKGLIRMVLQ